MEWYGHRGGGVTVDKHDVVILVPGLFGFGTFGEPPADLSYFEQNL